MIGVINDKCDFCGTCVAVCPFDAIDLYEARIEINQRCTDCMLCVWICPVETLAPLDAQGKIVPRSSDGQSPAGPVGMAIPFDAAERN